MATYPTTLQVLGMHLRTDGNHPTDAMYIDTPDSGRIINKGLTKREYFAAMAMQNMTRMYRVESADVLAKAAVAYADALIEELNK